MERLIIDGYNLLYCAEFDVPHHLDLEGQRNFLIQQLEIFCAVRGSKVTVVFDNVKNPVPGSGDTHASTGLVKIQYSAPGQEADEVIKRMIRREKAPATLAVVSSDRAIRFTARDHGISTISARAFASMLRTARQMQEPRSSDAYQITSEKYEGELGEDDIQFWKSLFEDEGDDD